MRILHVSSEVAPWSQTGGLGDVAGALPDALMRHDDTSAVAVVTPLYRSAAARLAAAGEVLGEPLRRVLAIGAHTVEVALRPLRRPGHADVWFVDAPALYDRVGIYGPGGGADFPDNHLRFAALCRAAVDGGAAMLGGPVDILHGHDWQAGLASSLIRFDPAHAGTGVVFTVHNLAYRGLFAGSTVAELGLPVAGFDSHGFEFWGQISMLKAGLAHADAATTVSPSYAQEILEPIAGEGLDGFLNHDVSRLVGILNGIDERAWDPATDAALAAPYADTDLTGKQACRRALAAEHGFTLGPGTVILAVVSRLAGQKGIDVVAELAPALHGLDARLIVLGSGDPALESRFRWLGEVFADNVSATIGFDVAHSRRIYAGADLFLMPSRFEPCGIGQLYAMRYGTIPVVHRVGGLRDTVIDPGDDGLAAGFGTGFVFAHADVTGLRWALDRAIAMYRQHPDAWRRLQRAAMRRDSSWTPSAREYVQLYRAVARARR